MNTLHQNANFLLLPYSLYIYNLQLIEGKKNYIELSMFLPYI